MPKSCVFISDMSLSYLFFRTPLDTSLKIRQIISVTLVTRWLGAQCLPAKQIGNGTVNHLLTVLPSAVENHQPSSMATPREKLLKWAPKLSSSVKKAMSWLEMFHGHVKSLGNGAKSKAPSVCQQNAQNRPWQKIIWSWGKCLTKSVLYSSPARRVMFCMAPLYWNACPPSSGMIPFPSARLYSVLHHPISPLETPWLHPFILVALWNTSAWMGFCWRAGPPSDARLMAHGACLCQNAFLWSVLNQKKFRTA